jgi:hypothetical protein
MQPDPLDFSSLDPATNGARWEAALRLVTERALAGPRRPVLFQLTAWARPTLALAAAAALLAWAPSLLFPAGETEAGGADAARSLSEWAAHSTSSTEVLSSLGGAHEQ